MTLAIAISTRNAVLLMLTLLLFVPTAAVKVLLDLLITSLAINLAALAIDKRGRLSYQ